MLAPHRRGAGDPTYRVDSQGRHWRGLRTPDGPVTLILTPRPSRSEVHAAAWGPGSPWALDRVPTMLGSEDDPSGFEPGHPVLIEAQRRHEHWRVGRSALVWESFFPAVLEQKVTGQEAFTGFRRLVHRFGERAPGPGAEERLWVQPSADQVAMIPSWQWLQAHVDPARSKVLVRAARQAAALERLTTVEAHLADRRLRSLPGVGVWTSAEVRSRALGDPDAVSFGDYHVAKNIGWALTGTPVDDTGLEELLEPWRGHRYRVQALLAAAGFSRPRRGPRMSPRTHLPVR